MNIEQEYQQAVKKAEELRREADRAEGRAEELAEQMAQEFECTPDQAEALCKRLEQEAKLMEAQFKEELAAFKEAFPNV
jgi:hypothetical protein